jgi:hypothetical protein
VIKNHILGGDQAVKFTACPTETPVVWGWSHAPFLGGVIEENTFEDSDKGAVLGVEHSLSNKSNKGRNYMTIALNRNVIHWSEHFLSQRARTGAKSLPSGLTLGYTPSHDAGELVVKAAGNRLEASSGAQSAASLIIHAADFNSQRLLNRKFTLSSQTRGSLDAKKPSATGSSTNRSRR